MVVDRVEQRYYGVVGVGALDLVRVPLIDMEKGTCKFLLFIILC